MKMKCYIINLDRARDRWAAVSQNFGELGFDVERIVAIDGRNLFPPYADFAPWRYFFCHGRPIAPNVIACHFSHLKALETFLSTDEEYALICEDDVTPEPETEEIIAEAMKYADRWDMLRLCAFKPTRGIVFASLPHGYHLQSDLKTASGNCARIVNRYAAEQILKKCVPMVHPHDVVLYYEWPIGIREATVSPFPIKLNDFNNDSCIGGEPRYPKWHYVSLRYLVLWPYRICSRTTRKISRIYWALKQSRAGNKK